MNNKYLLKLSVLFIVLTFVATTNVKAQNKLFDLNGGDAIETDFTVEFDLTPGARPPWAEVYIYPADGEMLGDVDISLLPLSCIHFGHDADVNFFIGYRAGDGVYDYDGGYDPGNVPISYSTVEYGEGITYHFKVEMFLGTMKQNIWVMADGETEYSVVAEDVFWPNYYSKPARLNEYTPGGVPLNVENITVDIKNVVTEWNFDTDGDTESWTGLANIGDVTAASGVLEAQVVITTMDDPAIHVGAVGVDLNTNTHVKLNLKNSTEATKANIIFMSASSPATIVKVPFDVAANSDFTDYTIDMSANADWKDGLVAVGVSVEGATGGSLALDYFIIGTDALSVNEFKANSVALKLYPSPASSDLKVSIDGKISQVKIFSVSGAELRSIDVKGNKELSVNVSNLNSGIYFVQVNSDMGIATKRFVKK